MEAKRRVVKSDQCQRVVILVNRLDCDGSEMCLYAFARSNAYL